MIGNYTYRKFESILNEFQTFVRDTIDYDIYIYVDDLSQREDYFLSEMGVFEYPNNITISNEEKYLACELGNLSKTEKREILSSNKFVKSVVIHEISHIYFNQIISEMKLKNKYIDNGYLSKKNYGKGFIEEGFCEYISNAMGETIIDKRMKTPKTIEELDDKYYCYEYSALFLKDFFDSFGVKRGLELLVEIPPPTKDEIINPEIFWRRIKKSFFLLKPYS